MMQIQIDDALSTLRITLTPEQARFLLTAGFVISPLSPQLQQSLRLTKVHVALSEDPLAQPKVSDEGKFIAETGGQGGQGRLRY